MITMRWIATLVFLWLTTIFVVNRITKYRTDPIASVMLDSLKARNAAITLKVDSLQAVADSFEWAAQRERDRADSLAGVAAGLKARGASISSSRTGIPASIARATDDSVVARFNRLVIP